MKPVIRILIAWALVTTAAAGVMTYNAVTLLDTELKYTQEQPATTTDPYLEYLESIGNRAEFVEWVEIEKEKIYWNEQAIQADRKLDEIRDRELENEQVRATKVQTYLEKRNPELAQYAADIAKLPRYVDVLAIAYQETKLCTVGVGEPGRNNCGAIKSHRADRNFKVYDTPLDALEDLSYLLHEPHMIGKSIEQLNGSYCVDEANGGGKCPDWTNNINSEKEVILNS